MRTKSEDKKKTILKAAMKLFLSNGYDNTSVDAIAKEAACSKATVYHYFSGKEELLREASELEIGSEMHEAVKKLFSTGTPRERLIAFGKAALVAQCGQKSVGFFRLLSYCASSQTMDLASMVKGPDELCDSLIRFFREEGLRLPEGIGYEDVFHVFRAFVFRDTIEAANIGIVCDVTNDRIRTQVEDGVDLFLRLFPLP